MHSPRSLALASLFLAAVLAAGCKDSGERAAAVAKDGAVTKPAPARTRKLVLATNSEPDTLDPIFAEMAVSTEVRFLGQRELTMYNEKWELVADLAETVPSQDNGLVKLIDTGEPHADGTPKQKMEVTWHIRKDATWEDGSPVDGEDFIFAWQVQMDATQEIIERDLPERIESMEAQGEDKKTLVVTWKEPFAFYDTFRVHSSYPAHALRARYKKPDGTTHNMKKDKYGQRPLSNGPFKFKEWVPGQYITYVKNERFHTPPQLDEVTIRFIPNNVALESALVAGDIDGVLTTGGLTLAEVEDLKRRRGDEFRYYSVPGLVWSHIDFNLDDPILKDATVRKAIAHGVNRQGLIDELYFGKYTLSHTFLPPRHWGYKNDVATLEFDLEKSARLFEQAGWRQAKEGDIRTNAKGDKLSLSLNAVAGIKDIEQLQQVIQSDLRKIGVELRIDNKPAKVFFGDLARYRKLPHMAFYAWVMDPSSWGNTLWQSDMVPSKENSWSGQNYPGWRHEEATRLLKAVPAILDENKRKELMARVQDLYVEDLPALPMYFRPVVSVTKKELKGFVPTGTQTPVTWNAGEWRFE
jgi:peptide/nickel transport system substrate-binding protein